MFSKLIQYAALLTLTFGTVQAMALQLQPMEQSLNPRVASTTFKLENSGSNPVTFEVKVYKRDIDGTAKEVRTATNDFVVFPKAGKTGPGQTQPIRVTYVGPKNIKSEVAYRVVVTQLPVDLPIVQKKGNISIKYVSTFEAALYFQPQDARPRVLAENVRIEGDKLRLRLVNQGTSHQLLSAMKLVVMVPGQGATEIDGSSLGTLQRVNLLAGKAINVAFPSPSGFVSGQGVQASVVFN